MKLDGRFGEFGGSYVPEILMPALEQLEEGFLAAMADTAFRAELHALLHEYAGRPTSLYRCRNLAAETGSEIWLKREDLLHGGAHKTNQALGQGLLAKRLGKARLIAETGGDVRVRAPDPQRPDRHARGPFVRIGCEGGKLSGRQVEERGNRRLRG